MSDFHGVFSRLSEGDNVSDAVAGITDALALVLMALVANGVVDAEKFATGQPRPRSRIATQISNRKWSPRAVF